MIRNITHAVSLATLIFSSTCVSAANASAPVPTLDDNGNVSFVRQVVPKILGRKPRGTLEVSLLKDITNLYGRETLVRLLMAQDEFISHWSAILIDHMKVQRADVLQKNRPQSAECFELATPNDVPTSLDASEPSNLAEFVRDSESTTPYYEDFNMHDLIRSSLHLDNLFPAYRGYLFTLASHPNTIVMRTAEQARAEVGAAFDDVFLNRNMQCISCHRGTYSTTGIGDRTHPLYQSLDNAVFDHSGDSELPDINPGDLLWKTITGDKDNTYKTKCAYCHGEKGAGDPASSTPGILGATKYAIVAAIEAAKINGGAMAGVTATTEELEAVVETLKDKSAFALNNVGETAAKHYAVFRRDFFSLEDPDAGEGPWNMSTDCASILDNVSEAIPAFFAGVDSQTATVQDVDEELHFGYQDLPIALPLMATLDPSNLIPGRTAFAYMLAAKITDNVWEQIFGERLTIVNQFSRNAWQKSMHQRLTETVFIANDWSLKELIVEILGTRFFNRQPPSSSFGSDPYRLHPIFDPFSLPDQSCIYSDQSARGDSGDNIKIAVEHNSDTTCAFNGQGELIHRYAPRVLLNSVSKALAWPAPKIFPGNSYPSEKFSAAIGQYTSEFDVGDGDVNFQALLEWDAQYGTCENPVDDEIDWIDTLVDRIDEFNNLNPGSPLTLGELVLTLKDWLIQEPDFGGYEGVNTGLQVIEVEPVLLDTDSNESDPLAEKKFDYSVYSEEQLVSGLFAASLAEQVSSNTVNEGKLRGLCGAYLKAPQFMLAGLVGNRGFDAPRYRVCNDTMCSYQSMCQAYSPVLDKLGHPTFCHPDSISVLDVKKQQVMYTTGKGADEGSATLVIPE